MKTNKAIAKKKAAGGVVETVKTVVYAVLIALVVRTVAYEPFNIPSGSMVPTLLVGDYLFVSKFSYGYSRYSLPFGLPLFSGRIYLPFSHLPQRGDVAVFKLPTDPSTDYIKRIVGLPGDHIQMRHGNLYINDQLIPRRPIEDFVYEEGGSASAETIAQGRLRPRLHREGGAQGLSGRPAYRATRPLKLWPRCGAVAETCGTLLAGTRYP